MATESCSSVPPSLGAEDSVACESRLSRCGGLSEVQYGATVSGLGPGIDEIGEIEAGS